MLIKYGVDFLFPKKHPRSMVHKAGEVPFGWAIRLNCTCIYIYIYIFFSSSSFCFLKALMKFLVEVGHLEPMIF